MVIFEFIVLRCSVHYEKDRTSVNTAASNASQSSNLREFNPHPEYVHLSGGMFVKYDPAQKTILWAWNHMLSQRYRAMFVFIFFF